MSKFEKIFSNESGDIKVVMCEGTNRKHALVEMLHLWHENNSGGVICFWVEDSEGVPEIQVVADRLTSTKYSFDILEALRYGQLLAEVILSSDAAKKDI